jgi:hypothetical protein
VSAVVLARLRGLFLDPGATPAAERSAAVVAERVAPPVLGVLTGPAEAAAAGAALGLVAASAAGCPCALVCRWTGGEPDDDASPAAAPSVGAARRLAARLGTRGLDVTARGRLVTVELPAAAATARAAAERAMAAASDVPVVLVIAGPRTATFDPLLAELDRLVVVPPPEAPAALEHLAVAAAARAGRATSVLRFPSSGTAAHRLTVACGLLLSPSLRAAAESALGGGDDG